MRKKIVAGNWKMNLTFEEGQQLTSELVNMYKDEAIKDVVTHQEFLWGHKIVRIKKAEPLPGKCPPRSWLLLGYLM
jgi:triosephosphate isomerase